MRQSSQSWSVRLCAQDCKSVSSTRLHAGRVDPRVGSNWVRSGQKIYKYRRVGSCRVHAVLVKIKKFLLLFTLNTILNMFQAI